MSNFLTNLQSDYLEFIREYIKENECAPQLKEIAEHFHVTSPTAHNTLEKLRELRFILFDRDDLTGFYIRLPERIATAELMHEISIVGFGDRFGEIHQFPKKHGHFPTAVPEVKAGSLYCIELQENITNNSMQVGDLILFDSKRKPVPNDIVIAPLGDHLFMVRVFPPIIDENQVFYELSKKLMPRYEDRIKSDPSLMFWWPLAHSKETNKYFGNLVSEQKIPWEPISTKHMMGTAFRLDRRTTV